MVVCAQKARTKRTVRTVTPLSYGERGTSSDTQNNAFIVVPFLLGVLVVTRRGS